MSANVEPVKNKITVALREDIADPKMRFYAIVADLAERKVDKDSVENLGAIMKLFTDTYYVLYVVGFYDMATEFIFTNHRAKDKLIKNIGKVERMRPPRRYDSCRDFEKLFTNATFAELSNIDDVNAMLDQACIMFKTGTLFDIDAFLAELAANPGVTYIEEYQTIIQRLVDDKKIGIIYQQ